MSEKVLGFKEITAKQEDGNVFYKIPANNLVPVVSLEWLKKYCKEHLEDSDCGEVIIPEYLLKAAKKQAGEKNIVALR